MEEGPMLVEDPKVTRLLKGMVRRMTTDVVLREDLSQEALIRLWMEETRHPGQTESWYLQNCHYHLQNSLNRGRSVDSPKRRPQSAACSAPVPTLDESTATGDDFPDSCSNGVESDIVSAICAHDAFSALQYHLTLRQRNILSCFMDGSGAREIARELGVSHVSVLKHRQRIATIASRLGIGALDARRRNGASPD